MKITAKRKENLKNGIDALFLKIKWKFTKVRLCFQMEYKKPNQPC